MDNRILLAHGSGGKLSHDLIDKYIVPALDNAVLEKLDDAAVLGHENGRLAFTTDSYVISPLFFPGGNIGKLAVCGTVNDLSMSGAVPKYLSLSLIIEEGLPVSELETIVKSIAETAAEAGISIVTGDTKVVNSGDADKLFINTAGIGVIPEGITISGAAARPGDAVIVSGTMGDHGMAIMCRREGLNFKTTLESDCAPLNGLVRDMLDESVRINCLRDPTRGGLASTLNEIAGKSGVGIELEEDRIPVRDEVRGACELLGLDPLNIANEGKLVAVVDGEVAGAVLARMRQNIYGKNAVIIGRVTAEHPGKVVIKTPYGSSRILDMLSGELLPRIC
ncbi:MAG: hydrogenase expression/formation protein HypE [Dehalococcoidales bacterium]|nr:hydrogenase expression/formation protein HypE [Dehalococcoidales bacterium]